MVESLLQQPCVTIHFTWKQEWPAVSKLLPVIEKELAPFQRPATLGKIVYNISGGIEIYLREIGRLHSIE